MSTSPTPFLIDSSERARSVVDEIPAAFVVAGQPTADIWAAPTLPGARELSYGVWVGQPGSIRADGYPHDEVFVLITGLVRLDSADGSSLEVRPGETCFIPCGWTGVWTTVVEAKKTYFIAGQPEEVSGW